MISTIFLQVQGIKLLEKGLEDASKSDSQVINALLSGALLFLLVIFALVIRYLIKDKKSGVQAAYENAAKESAINEGAHQAMLLAKDHHITHVTDENKNLKVDFMNITKDNTEVYRQLVIKVGSFVEGQAVVAANQERNKSEILLEVNRLFSQLKN